MADGAERFEFDYFISRAGADAAAAQEVADVLREAGHTVRYQDEDIPLGANFVAEMNTFLGQCRHFVMLLSRAYDGSVWCREEWQNFWVAQGEDNSRRLALIMVEACAPPPLLRGRVFADLTGVADAVRRRDLILAAAEGRAARVVTRPPIFGNVPSRNPAFTGRDELLAELHGKLHGGTAHMTALTQAIAGLGGVGKTQTAAEYCHRHQADYWGVWWIVGDSRTALEQGLAQLGARIEPKYAEVRTSDAAAFALEHIGKGSPKPWLLVFDNVERPDDLTALRPHANAHVLITSRWTDWGGVADSLGVRVLAPDAAVDLLMKRAPKHTDADGAEALAKDLGYLPLALEQAAAFCNRTGTAFATYRLMIADMLKDGPVAATFGPAIQRAAQESPHAERLLGILAFMAPEKIPLEIVGDEVMSAVERAEAVAALTSVSLIEVAPEAAGPGLADVHRLVQAVVQGRMSEEDREAGAALAVRLVAGAFPAGDIGPGDVRSWPACARLLPHALATIETGPQSGKASAPTARLASKCGLYFLARADYAAAESLMRRALAIDEAAHGPDHPTVAIRLNNLAQLLQTTGRLREAEEPMRRALAIGEAAYGPDHPTVALRLNNLAVLREEGFGDFEESERLKRRALAIWEKALGPGHTQVATGLNNLAQLLKATGRLREAEEPMRWALAIDEAAYGPDHPEVATDLNNLAQLLQDTDRLREAEEPMRRALAIDEAAYRPEHPYVARDLNNLAQLMQATGRLTEAEEPMRRVVEIFEKSLGADHPNVATALNNLAQLLQDTGRLDEAEEPMRRALAIWEKALGSEHTQVALGLNNLAQLLKATGRLKEAEAPMRRAVEILERTIPDHPNTQTARRNLAALEAAMRDASLAGAATASLHGGSLPRTQGGEGAPRRKRRRWGLLFVLLLLLAIIGLGTAAAILQPERLRALLGMLAGGR